MCSEVYPFSGKKGGENTRPYEYISPNPPIRPYDTPPKTT